MGSLENGVGEVDKRGPREGHVHFTYSFDMTKYGEADSKGQ